MWITSLTLSLFTVFSNSDVHPFLRLEIHFRILCEFPLSSVRRSLHQSLQRLTRCFVKYDLYPISPLAAIFEVCFPTERKNLQALFWTDEIQLNCVVPHIPLPYIQNWLHCGRIKFRIISIPPVATTLDIKDPRARDSDLQIPSHVCWKLNVHPSTLPSSHSTSIPLLPVKHYIFEHNIFNSDIYKL